LQWAGGDLALVKDCAETVLRVARQILLDLTPTETPPHDGLGDDDAAGTRRGPVDEDTAAAGVA
jgi:hypothetical protein